MKKSQIGEADCVNTVVKTKVHSEVKAEVEGYQAAVKEFASHKEKIKKIKDRIYEIEAIIREEQASSKGYPDLSLLTIEEIKEVADEKQVNQHRIHALNAARDVAVKALGDLEFSNTGFNMLVTDTKRACWLKIFEDLLKQLPEGLLSKILHAASMSSLPVQSIQERLLAFEYTDTVLNELSKEYGVPV